MWARIVFIWKAKRNGANGLWTRYVILGKWCSITVEELAYRKKTCHRRIWIFIYTQRLIWSGPCRSIIKINVYSPSCMSHDESFHRAVNILLRGSVYASSYILYWNFFSVQQQKQQAWLSRYCFVACFPTEAILDSPKMTFSILSDPMWIIETVRMSYPFWMPEIWTMSWHRPRFA